MIKMAWLSNYLSMNIREASAETRMADKELKINFFTF